MQTFLELYSKKSVGFDQYAIMNQCKAEVLLGWSAAGQRKLDHKE